MPLLEVSTRKPRYLAIFAKMRNQVRGEIGSGVRRRLAVLREIASRLMSEALDRSEARRITLVEEKADGSDIARREVPPATLRLISQILALIARQQTLVLYPESSELTTKQAAEVVGVSRPFLIRVLEAGEIPYRKVGRHRRVLMKDVLAYKEKMQVKGRAAMDELVKLSEEMGGYDL